MWWQRFGLLTLYSSATFTSKSTRMHMTAGTKVVTDDLSSLAMLLFLFVSGLLNAWFVLNADDLFNCTVKKKKKYLFCFKLLFSFYFLFSSIVSAAINASCC